MCIMKNRLALTFIIIVAATLPLLQAQQPVSVTTIDELLAALGHNQTIQLQPGEYDLGLSDTVAGPFHHWECGFSKRELHITGVQGLTIQGQRHKKATLASEMVYGFMVVFEQCNNLSLASLTFARGSQNPESQGGPLQLIHCNNVGLTDMQLHSNRQDGLRLVECNKLRIAASRIDHCHGAIVVLDRCSVVMFADCDFAANEGHKLIQARACLTVQFHQCGFINNVATQDGDTTIFFDVVGSQDIGVFGGAFVANEADFLANSRKLVNFDKVQFHANNVWRKSRWLGE